MNKEQLQNAMLYIFSKILERSIQNGLVDPSNFLEFYKFAEKWVFGCKARSFWYEGRYISVDFALGAGSMVGNPTNSRHITVYYDDDNNCHYQRFTKKQLVKLAHVRYSYGQLTLF